MPNSMNQYIDSFLILGIAFLLSTSLSTAQEKGDSTVIFEPANPHLLDGNTFHPKRNAWGVDLMASNNGFAGGGFFRKEYSDELAWFVSMAISDVKDEAEVEYFDYYGQSFVRGKKNRALMIPITGGVQYRLFKDDIVENFRPYITAGIGPTILYVSPYANYRTVTSGDGISMTIIEQIDFFSSLGKGQAKYTIGGFVGFGAYFGVDRGTLSGVSIRYYYVPYPQGIEILFNTLRTSFGGIYLTLNFGSIY